MRGLRLVLVLLVLVLVLLLLLLVLVLRVVGRLWGWGALRLTRRRRRLCGLLRLVLRVVEVLDESEPTWCLSEVKSKEDGASRQSRTCTRHGVLGRQLRLSVSGQERSPGQPVCSHPHPDPDLETTRHQLPSL